MRGRKVYGQSQVTLCPWCGKNATSKTDQGVPCCLNHKKAEMPNMKCACGDWLDVAEGKFGAYFRCMTCGNKSFQKGLEMNDLSIGSVPNSAEQEEKKSTPTKEPSKPKEIVVTSDEADFIYEMYH